MIKKLLAAAIMAALPVSTHADTIDLGVGTPGSVVTIASGGDTSSVSGANIGGFIIDVSGTGNPPLTSPVLLDGNTIDVRTAGSATGNIWVSSTNNTSPTGLQSFLSSFTQNLLTAGWTVTAFTYADNTNAAFGTQQLLAETLFTASDQPDVLITNTANLGPGPFSLSERWEISAIGAGETNNTTDIASVPGPVLGTGIPGIIAGLGFLTFVSYKRRRAKHGTESVI